MKAIWNNVVIADSDQTIEIEGNHYFPPKNVNKDYLEESRTHTTSSSMGEATYYHVQVNGEVILDAAWSYPDPKEAAKEVRFYIAFGKGVRVE
ncbi:DUF427 domain-containing protein [Pontibacter locisalis]|uniref:DUF427 domain-containing protein n=1 Tax=Pontibacter locisalis TaxID=1719035 RepID=A0ABW5IJ96_9BACT